MPDTTEEKMLAKLEQVTQMLDFALLQLRDTNLRLTEILMRLPSLEPPQDSLPARKE
jgi:hypothetical protein